METCWLFEKTGEKRAIKSGEWGVVNARFPEPYHWDYDDDCREFSILKLTEFSSNPFEPIKEVWDKWSEEIRWFAASASKPVQNMAEAISEAMKRMEGK